jgi:predicted nucleotidyltransferase
MEKIIKSRIENLEKEKDIKILFACESGSRAWGFPSPDSDYDVRIFYLKKKNTYLSIKESETQITLPNNDKLDLSGWDLQKTLALLFKSNATPFEWIQSPIIYLDLNGFKDGFWQFCQEYANPKTLINHYLGIAKGALEYSQNGNLNIKKFFYVVRPILAAKWVVECNNVPPMNIKPLSNLMNAEEKALLYELIEIKGQCFEKSGFEIPSLLTNFINSEIKILDKKAKLMTGNHCKIDKLDEFFVKTLEQYDN